MIFNQSNRSRCGYHTFISGVNNYTSKEKLAYMTLVIKETKKNR